MNARPARAATEVDIRQMDGARDVAHASLVLGEQRAWISGLLGRDLEDFQPQSRVEYASLETTFRPPAGALLLARLDDDPVGVVGIRRQGGDVAEIVRMYVRERARGLGLGRRLLAGALDTAAALGARRVRLTTLPAAMPEAVALYLSLGFRTAPTRHFRGVHGVVDLDLDLPEGPRAHTRPRAA